jgi:hypothetical protein
LKGNTIYAISRSRAFLSKLPSLSETEKYVELGSEKELLDRIARKINYPIQASTIEEYFKELVGRFAYELSKETPKALGELNALVLENIKKAFFKKITEHNLHYYTYEAKPLAEDALKKVESANDLNKIKLGNYTLDLLIKFPIEILQNTKDPGLLEFAFEKIEITEIIKHAGYNLATQALIDLHNYKVCAFASQTPFSESLYIKQKIKCKDLQEAVMYLSKKYNVENPGNFDTLSNKLIYITNMYELSNFSDKNVINFIEILKVYEKIFIGIANSIKEKFSKEIIKKVYSL